LGLEEGVAEDLHREDCHGSDHQAQHDDRRLSWTAHRLSQRQPGQKGPADREHQEHGVYEQEKADHHP
jgi:hypothetical protein